jgi:cytochrome b561
MVAPGRHLWVQEQGQGMSPTPLLLLLLLRGVWHLAAWTQLVRPSTPVHATWQGWPQHPAAAMAQLGLLLLLLLLLLSG